jgi:hypothetical protein
MWDRLDLSNIPVKEQFDTGDKTAVIRCRNKTTLATSSGLLLVVCYESI